MLNSISIVKIQRWIHKRKNIYRYTGRKSMLVIQQNLDLKYEKEN